MKINFVLLACPKITGGPLAILEYAQRLHQRGHEVSITTSPPFTWGGPAPFPWFNFSGKIYYQGNEACRGVAAAVESAQGMKRRFQRSWDALARHFRSGQGLRSLVAKVKNVLFLRRLRGAVATLGGLAGFGGIINLYTSVARRPEDAIPLYPFFQEATMAMFLMNAMPDCDVNIATMWSTAIPVYFSGKGRPAIFMQHYEEILYPVERNQLANRLLTRFALALPIYKIANSSWLAKEYEKHFGQKIPFANNALVVEDFPLQPKKSATDGILRVVTYTRPAEWKGFQDAVAAMQIIRAKFGPRVQWHVFGYENPAFPPDNPYAPYEYHPQLSFAQLARLYAESDVTLCPSWYESFPLPPLESMAAGTAVVTTGYGTEDYAFHEQNALVVKSRDVAGMAAAVTRLLEDSELRERLAQAGRAKAEEYSWDRAVDVREQMLKDICSGNVGYDVFASTRTGIVDQNGLPFEISPPLSDHPQPEKERLIRVDRRHVYLLRNGCKREITDSRLLRHDSLCDVEMVDVDTLTGYRIPTGCPIM